MGTKKDREVLLISAAAARGSAEGENSWRHAFEFCVIDGHLAVPFVSGSRVTALP
jgi:hypothetical protein